MNKAVAALFAAMLAAVAPLVASYPLTISEWVNVGAIAAGAVVVWIARNDPPGSVWSMTKAILAGVAAVGVILSSALIDQQLSETEMFQVLMAVAAAVAVYAVPNPTVGRHRAVEEKPEK